VGLAETRGYREWVSVPSLPDSVAEIGLRSTPNLEMVASLRPDIILSTPQFAAIEPVLGSIAPVLSLATFTDNLQPLAKAEENTVRLGQMLGHEDAAQKLINGLAADVDRLRLAARGKARKIVVVAFHDDRHIWVFTKGSLYADVMSRAGLANAWTATSNSWGIANASVDELVGLEEAALVIVEPVPISLRLKLQARQPGTLVGEMEIFRSGRYRIIPPNWGFGGLTSAARFARALTGLGEFIRSGNAA
jgi:iron complex transport system substrate-binding protein